MRDINGYTVFVALLAGVGLVGSPSACAATAAATATEDDDRAAPIVVAATAAPPTIDGALDDPCWAGPAPITGFLQSYPSPGQPSWATTEVWLAWDAAALYVAVRAEDDPRQVRASLHARDDLGDDDTVTLYLDTFGDGSRAYTLRLNALGAHQDGVFVEGSGTDLSVDLEVRSAGRITPSGFELEAAISLSSLRYPARAVQQFGLLVARQSRHRSEESSWPPLPPDPSVRFPLERKFLLGHGRPILVEDSLLGRPWLDATPSVSARADRERRGGDSSELDGGLALRAGRGANLVGQLAYRPDFGEVEADAPVLTANNPFPLYFPERRPFFLEGIELWRTLTTTVDTRRIEAPELAVQGSWQTERNALAVLAASEPDRGGAARASAAEDLLVRHRYSLGEESWVGSLVTLRRSGERENVVASVDGRVSLGVATTLAAQLSGSRTDGSFYDPDRDLEEQRIATGFGYALDLERRAAQLAVRVSARGFTPDYRADLGYLARADTHQLQVETRYSPPPRSESRLVSWAFLHTAHLAADSRGRSHYAYLWPRVELTFGGSMYLHVAAYLDYRKLLEADYGPRRAADRAGAFLGPGERSTIYNGATVTLGGTHGTWSGELILDATWNTFDYDFGAGPRFPRVSPTAIADPAAPLDPGSGDTQTAILTVRWQPTQRWVATLAISRDRLRRDDTGLDAYRSTLGSLRLERHFSRSTFLRLRVDHDSLVAKTTAEVLFSYEPRPGTALHLGVEERGSRDGFDPVSGRRESGWREEGRSAFVKLSHTLRHR